MYVEVRGKERGDEGSIRAVCVQILGAVQEGMSEFRNNGVFIMIHTTVT